MKYRKPQYAFTSCINRDSIDIVTGAKQLVDFLRSLPDEFEIVPDGHVCVKWPDGLTRDKLEQLARYGAWNSCTDALFFLAAIAPEKKKRMAELWLHVSGQKLWKFSGDNWRLNATDWRKVGECEIEN